MVITRLPTYPLFVKDPYFSIWSKSDVLNEENVIFWHGEEKPVYGIVEVNGTEYSFLGTKTGAGKLLQTKIELTAFSTDYYFENELFSLKVQFLSPLLPTDIELASCPVCYMRYALTPKTELGEFKVKLAVEERICYNTCGCDEDKQPVRMGVLKAEGYQTAFMGLRRQMPLSNAIDEIGADWGYYYVVGEYASNERIGEREFITACNVHNGEGKGSLYLAFDDIVSIFYYGEFLKGYFFKDGKTIFDAIEYSMKNEEQIVAKCEAFDEQLKKDTAAYGEEYLYVLYAALRQSMGGHKLVQDKKGRILFLSKECNSDGCIATVDVSYPTFPLCYKYNKELLKGMLYPIFDFVRMPVWEENFAPHDAGVYPYCCGQLYAVWNEPGKDYAHRLDGKPESLPMYYLFPKGNDVFNLKKQMPVEECANMIILSFLTGDKNLLNENFEVLTRWLEYLLEKGLVPDNQLCTDDFTGHCDKNANLAIKAIIGIKAYAHIAELLGHTAAYEKYIAVAKEYAKKWQELYVINGKSVLNFGNENSFSLKYNLAIDALFGERMFPETFAENEVALYLEKMNRYGVPLDNRAEYTKSDWCIWAASLTKDVEKRKLFVKAIANFLRETPDRVPFSDWYETKSGTYHMFRNRTVQGGLFMFLVNEQ